MLTGAWWDLVDENATRLVGPVLLAHPGEVTPVIQAWAVDADLWVRRTAILSQLKHKDATDTALLETVSWPTWRARGHGREFFIRKAIGWALREQARTDPGWVVDLLDRHADRLSALSRREAAKHLPRH